MSVHHLPCLHGSFLVDVVALKVRRYVVKLFFQSFSKLRVIGVDVTLVLLVHLFVKSFRPIVHHLFPLVPTQVFLRSHRVGLALV